MATPATASNIAPPTAIPAIAPVPRTGLLSLLGLGVTVTVMITSVYVGSSVSLVLSGALTQPWP